MEACLEPVISGWLNLLPLTPKGQMVFFKFWAGSHGMSFTANFFDILGLVLLFEIYLIPLISKSTNNFEIGATRKENHF